MQSNNNSLNSTHTTRDTLSYVNDLVIQATSEGKYFIFVESTYMDDDMMWSLISDYGYEVSKRTNDFGTFVTYFISWDEGYLQTESLLFLTDERGIYLDKDEI